MLYIKLNISDNSCFSEFQKLFDHMVATRQPDYDMEEDSPTIDWDTMSAQEIENYFDSKDSNNPVEINKIKRFKNLFPPEAQLYLAQYHQKGDSKMNDLADSEILGWMDYLEFNLEVDMDQLDKIDDAQGMVQFSTGNFPYGGMERLLLVLKAFGLTPVEIFNGFSVCDLLWQSDFDYEVVEIPDKTKIYLDSFKK